MTPPLRLTAASAPLTNEIAVRDEFGVTRQISIPAERPLTVFVDKRELVTLMTLGAAPELLVLGYLRNQRLVDRGRRRRFDHRRLGRRRRRGQDARRHRALRREDGQARRHHRLRPGHGVRRPDGRPGIDPSCRRRASRRRASARPRSTACSNAIRLQESTYKSAGSVHGCALFRQQELLTFVEDVGRHNAIDTIAGWMWLNGVGGGDKIFYTTGRLTSEMVIKSAQMGMPIDRLAQRRRRRWATSWRSASA